MKSNCCSLGLPVWLPGDLHRKGYNPKWSFCLASMLGTVEVQAMQIVSTVHIGKVQFTENQKSYIRTCLWFMSVVLLSLVKRKVSNLVSCLWFMHICCLKILNWFTRWSVMRSHTYTRHYDSSLFAVFLRNCLLFLDGAECLLSIN